MFISQLKDRDECEHLSKLRNLNEPPARIFSQPT